ncbi:probable sodium/metabolite cotransporter BASS4, chloroplastic isoform X1 [Ricinus communis]|uniref:Probable sodium/metabolite cotransporter BASS4, chloroplastic n=1 Tax=Ricinus communis TaxID=3988 RepID=B9SG77_RICCO|nr:probable sodium/metabolite cotransporter BASS4, chloroplastic isoform X1 [Ricinus communis]EEF37403.1 bile acid:sodium symporter, putative [Ricinus communis]|eukprot:XP_002524996.1 probable sodium/metabolite cotransporter BASS4, chloroplastic [Ricinus communis]
MAGIVQSLILSPRSLQPPSIQQRHPNFRSICNPYSLKRTRCVPSPIKIKACQQPDQGDSKVSGLANVWSQPLFSFVENNFLPMALIGGVVVGLANPSLGCLADKCYLSKVSTFGIFFISGLTLRNGEIGAALEAWLVGVFGLCSILFITPYFSRIILQIQLQPQEFVTGLALFCCMPTTLSSGVALTQLAGGNSALALAMTVISNLLGILIIPFSISRFIGAGVGVSVPTKQLLRSLVLTLLVPLILGKVFRESSKGLENFVDQNRKLFSKMSAICLSLVPWIQVSRSRSLLLMVKPEVFLVAVGMGVFLHIILFSFNALAIQGLATVSGGNWSVFAKKENADAFVLVTSQKTLPVLAAVVEQLGGAFGESGLLVLPCVAAHLNQIIMDSFLVNFWLRKDTASENGEGSLSNRTIIARHKEAF